VPLASSAVPFADANGQRLYYEVHGEGEPLLMIQGLGTDHLGWILQVPVLSRSHRVVVFDNRDVGQSSLADEEYEIADMAQDALGLADALELDSFHLVGMSMGGAIAQELALAAPERVETLQLVVTWAGSGRYGVERTRHWAALTNRLSHEEHLDNLLLLGMSERFFEDERAVERAREFMRANPHPQPPKAFARQLAADGRHETRDRLGSLGMPVHVIGAEQDILVPVWKSLEIAELVPGARLTVVEAAPHAVNLEHAEDFNRLLLDFVAEHAAVS
jgi:3-oxoadipate enol-lactonase